jgi:phage terminase large subunit
MPTEVDLPIVGKVHRTLVNSQKRHRIIVGGRGKGASWSIARVLLARGMVEPRFIVCIREVQKSIEHSVKKLLDDTIDEKELRGFYRSKKYEIVGVNGTKIIFHGLQDYNADNIKSLEGGDDFWVAEAQTISRRSINILRPTIRKPGSVCWWDFNPRYETDPVYVDYILNQDPNAEVLWLNWIDNPWFTKELQMELESDYRRNEEEARHIWEGELRAAGDLFVCPSALVDVAIKNTILDVQTIDMAVGADIAHQGGDEIVFYKRHGLKIIDKYFSRYQDTLTTVRHLKAFTTERSIPINIDNGDLGKAVADLLENDRWLVNRINFGGTPSDTEHYQDCATEMYFQLRDTLEFADIPNDEELRNQLIQRKFKYISGRRGYEVMKIESKDEFKTHATAVHKSPDRADGLVLAYYNQKFGADKAQTLSHDIY